MVIKSQSISDINKHLEDLYRKVACLKTELISEDPGNALVYGSDGKLYVSISGVVVVSTDADNSIVAGTDGGAYYTEPVPQTIVSTDSDNSITAGTDGGAYFDASGMVTEGGAQDISNKRIFPRIFDHGSSATPTIDATSYDEVHISNLAVNITSMTTNFSNSPFNGQELIIVVKGTASRTITWGASFAGGDVLLPTTTDGTRALVVKFKIINSVSTTVFQCLAVTNVGA